MAHPLHHAESSARKFGGVPSDYQAVHDWFDASKEHLALFTHRALRHHAQGLFEAERVFGLTLTNSAGRDIPVRWIGEQHVKEDCNGIIPSMADWMGRITPAPWMGHGQVSADRETYPVRGTAQVTISATHHQRAVQHRTALHGGGDADK